MKLLSCVIDFLMEPGTQFVGQSNFIAEIPGHNAYHCAFCNAQCIRQEFNLFIRPTGVLFTYHHSSEVLSGLFSFSHCHVSLPNIKAN